MKTRHHVLFLFTLFSLVILLLFSEILLSAEMRKLVFRFPKIDIVGHFISFFSLTWVVHSIIKLPIKVTLVTLIIYAGLTELGQAYLGFRTGEFTDFLADIVGIITFFILKYAYHYLQNRHISKNKIG